MTRKQFDSLCTFVFIAMALGVWGHWVYTISNDNINWWQFTTGMVLWLLAVANAKINELIYKDE